jgi:hypothetical protein
MKYSLLALLFVMSILAYADYDLDKPTTVNMGGTLRIAKSDTTDYLNGLSIATLVKVLLGEEKISTGYYSKTSNEIDSDVVVDGDASGATISVYDNHWDSTTEFYRNWDEAYGTSNPKTTYSWKDNDTSEETVSQLVTALTKYKQNFPSVMQLVDATITNGCTSTINSYNDKSTVSSGLTDKNDTFENSPGINLLIYAGRYTTANDWVPGKVMTVETSQGRYHVYAYDTTTPIVLDLDGDGNLEASKGQHLPHTLCVPESELVAFDINADGFEELVEWVGANDGLLVHDIVNNEVSAKNLFGDATGFKNGFEQLATLDANKDGALTGEELAGLSVWQDKNGNAKIDEGEIHTLESLGITKLNVEAIELTATFERNGKYYKMWDWNPVTIMVKKAK